MAACRRSFAGPEERHGGFLGSYTFGFFRWVAIHMFILQAPIVIGVLFCCFVCFGISQCKHGKM